MAFPSLGLSRVFVRSGVAEAEAERLTVALEDSIDEKVEESRAGLATTHALDLAVAQLLLAMAEIRTGMAGIRTDLAERETAFHRTLWIAVGIVLTAIGICTAIILTVN